MLSGEQSKLEDLLIKYASDPHVARYAKIAEDLRGKTVRDIALRCRWMNKEMLQLFLCEPAWDDDTVNDEFCRQIISLLDELEQVIWSFISTGGRSKARLWLCNTISGINSISPRHQQDLFLSLLRSKPIKWHLASQLLQLIFEKQPHKMGPTIAKKSHKLENFFKGNPRRILQWFSNFADTGNSDHGKGAKALSQFAFVNRDICWEELEWKGKHGQSPAMVATKPHYFLDLDVQRTVENFLEYVPEFWSSHEFSESLKDGSILLIDTNYFVDLFADMMYEEELEVWEVITEFIAGHSFSFLCHRLLIILEEQDLYLFLDLLPKYLTQKSETFGIGIASEWFEIILSKYSGSITIDQLLLLTAVTCQGRHLLRLLREEGDEEQKEKIKNLVSQLCELSNHPNDLATILKEGLKRKPLVVLKRLGMQSWVIHFKLSQEFRTTESWESLFMSSGIKFRKSDKYALLHDDEFLGDSESDYDRRSSVSLKHKKHRKHNKKRKRNFNPTEDELVGYNLSNDLLDVQSKVGDWLLSTDGYSTTWSSVDLPEHLSRHCFTVWLKWVFAKS